MKKISTVLFMILTLALTACSAGETLPPADNYEHDLSVDRNEVTTPAAEPELTPGVSSGAEEITAGIPEKNPVSVTAEPEPTPATEPVVTDEPAPTDVMPEHVVVLDPGHGGAFEGAWYNGMSEKAVTLKIANYAKDYLEEHYPQITVYLTRDTDADFADTLKEDLENRVQIGKELGAEVLVSLHLNASVNHNQSGAMVFCPHRTNVKDESFALAEEILLELEKLGLTNHGPRIRESGDTYDENGNPVEYYAINRHSANRDMPGIIVEHCFMDSETDAVYLEDEDAIRKLGEADARGIAAYFGY